MIAKSAAKTTTILIAAAHLGFSLSTRRISTTRTTQTFGLLSSLNFKEPEEPQQQQDESVSKWEDMYQQGAKARQEQIYSMKADRATAAAASRYSEETVLKAPVKVITFDLDNTLWKTGPTIGAANDALAEYLSTKRKEDGSELQIPRRIEKVMGDLFAADRRRYCPLVGATIPEDIEDEEQLLAETCKSPVLLTQLRIDAMCHVLETENGFSEDNAMELATEAFGVWMQGRYDSILDNMAPKVVETLENIRSTIQTDTGAPVLLGAVTDGNSDPRNLEMLEPYFDFCVNAESVGVSKPDKRVYLEAIRTAIATRPDVFADVLPLDDIDMIDSQTLEDSVGPYWCHIGDDFLKDVVAAKDMKMRTIFAIGLVKDKLQANNTKSEKMEKMDVAEFLKKVSSQTIVTMGIGADDYLADSLHREFVDEVAQDFSEIGNILVEWHKETVVSEISTDTIEEEKPKVEPPSVADPDEEQKILEVIEPSSAANADSVPVTPIANKNEQGEVNFLLPRAFRVIREDCSVDIPAPLRKRDERTMKEVMGLAQREKSSGVFAFDPSDVTELQKGKKVLMIKIGDTDLEFSRDIFTGMSVEEVLSLTEENPVQLSLYMTDASEQESFDLF
mmetsp:Transcript_17834/g.44494  ORF Transcript_17834/g.44494 Transcript_17834/m.44494 type:complete len:619 (+) Transcript_17834:117-1973(+)